MIKCLCAIFRDLSRCFSWRDDQEFPATDKKKNPSLFFSFSCFNLWLWITSRRCRLLRFGFKSHSSGNAFILLEKKIEHRQSSRLLFLYIYVKDGKWSFFDYDGTTIMRPVFSANQLDWGRLYNLVRDEKRSGVFGHQTTFVCQFFFFKETMSSIVIFFRFVIFLLWTETKQLCFYLGVGRTWEPNEKKNFLLSSCRISEDDSWLL